MYIITIEKRYEKKIQGLINSHNMCYQSNSQEYVSLNINPCLASGGHSEYGEKSLMFDFIYDLKVTLSLDFLLAIKDLKKIDYKEKYLNPKIDFINITNAEKIDLNKLEDDLIEDEQKYTQKVINNILNTKNIYKLRDIKQRVVKLSRSLNKEKVYNE